MGRQLAVGERAPDFDLSSTEGVVLTLRDEVPRNPVLLYFFSDAGSEQTRRDLTALAAARGRGTSARMNILGIAPLAMPELTALQSDLGLPFPLLRDDRGLSAAYGVSEDAGTAPTVVLVGRDQSVRSIAAVSAGVEASLAQLTAAAGKQSPTANYPKSVINRLVDRWVN